MPYTAKQRARFHAGAQRGEPGMAKLASEADAYAKAGKEKPPVKKSTQPAAVRQDQMPMPAARNAEPGKRQAMPAMLPAWVEAAQAEAQAQQSRGPKRTPRKAK